MRSLIAAAILALASSTAQAAANDVWGVATLTSQHFPYNHENQTNLGVGLEYGLTEHARVVVGEYKNSQSIHSNYAGIVYSPWTWGHWHPGMMFGFISGYSPNYSFAPLPVMGYERQRWGANVIFAHTGGQSVLGLQVKFKFR